MVCSSYFIKNKKCNEMEKDKTRVVRFVLLLQMNGGELFFGFLRLLARANIS
jgi:hypothetical protein